jgi:hypothetical protein
MQIFSIFFCLVMFHEALWPLKKCKLSYMHINFIQSFSFNHWIKINIDSKFTLNSKMLLCKFWNFLLVFKIAKGYHQNFSLLCTIILVIDHFFWWKVVHPQCVFTHLLKWTLWWDPRVLSGPNCCIKSIARSIQVWFSWERWQSTAFTKIYTNS